jgi:hypothetical protein
LNQVDPITAAPHLRLVWPQWQGAGTESVRSLAAEFPFDIARRGYSVGTKVLEAVLPEHDGPTAIVPVEMGDIGLEVPLSSPHRALHPLCQATRRRGRYRRWRLGCGGR